MVGCWSLRRLGVEPYTWALLKQGLKSRAEPQNVERNETLDRAMEYTGLVGMELVDMLASINSKVEDLAPRMPMQHTFSGDGLNQFIQDHQDCLEQLEDQLSNVITMTERLVMELHLQNEVYHQDFRRVKRLNSELLIRVMVLEGCQDHPIEIPDSPVPILIPAPGGNLLVEIVDGTNDDMAQVVAEDLAEGVGVRRVMREEGGVFRINGEVFKDGEDVMDVLCWVAARDQEILRYTQPPNYDDPNYIPDR